MASVMSKAHNSGVPDALDVSLRTQVAYLKAFELLLREIKTQDKSHRCQLKSSLNLGMYFIGA